MHTPIPRQAGAGEVGGAGRDGGYSLNAHGLSMRRVWLIIGKLREENISNGIWRMAEFGWARALDSGGGRLPVGDCQSRSCFTRIAGATTFIAGISHWKSSVAPKAPAN